MWKSTLKLPHRALIFKKFFRLCLLKPVLFLCDEEYLRQSAFARRRTRPFSINYGRRILKYAFRGIFQPTKSPFYSQNFSNIDFSAIFQRKSTKTRKFLPRFSLFLTRVEGIIPSWVWAKPTKFAPIKESVSFRLYADRRLRGVSRYHAPQISNR